MYSERPLVLASRGHWRTGTWLHALVVVTWPETSTDQWLPLGAAGDQAHGLAGTLPPHMGRGERIVGRPWTDVPRLPVTRKRDPWARQAPLPGGTVRLLRQDYACVSQYERRRRCLHAGRRLAGRRRNRSAGLTDVRTMRAVCLSPGCATGRACWDRRTRQRTSANNGTVSPYHRASGTSPGALQETPIDYRVRIVGTNTWAGCQLVGE